MTLPLWVQIVAVGIPSLASLVAAIIAGRFANRARLAESQAARLLAMEERTAQRKHDVYEPMIRTLGDMLNPGRSQAALGNAEAVMGDFQNLVTIWGSDEVVEAFYRFRRAVTSDPPGHITIRLTADLLLAMRRDVASPGSIATPLHVMGPRLNDLKKDDGIWRALTRPFDEVASEHNWPTPW